MSGTRERRVPLGPHPRALLLGLEGEEADVAGLFPVSRTIKELSEVLQEEWDVLVVRAAALSLRSNSPAKVAPHLFVLALGTGWLPSPRGQSDTDGASPHVGAVHKSVSVDLVIPPNLPPTVHRLVEYDLVPSARARKINLTLTYQAAAGEAKVTPDIVRPFLQTSDGLALAGAFRRTEMSECWALPNPVKDLPAWVAAAVVSWRELRPDIFPGADWRTTLEWQSPAEASLAEQLQQIEEERTILLADLEQREGSTSEKLSRALAETDAGERRLLTGQGDGLVAAVSEALSELGFDVTDMDEIHPVGDKREDLRVTHRSDDEWLALVEVRGYKRGAQQGDLMRLLRFQKRFHQDETRWPSALWYIVNHFLDDDPSTRPLPLVASEADIEAFAEDVGLILDTRDLFRLLMAVRRGDIPPETAVDKLMRGHKRYVFESAS